MKNKYNIKFKYGLGYGGEIHALIYNLLSKKHNPKNPIENFYDELDSINKRTLPQLKKFISKEPFDIHAEDPNNIERKKVLEQLLPSLFLRKSTDLMDMLKVLGINKEVETQFFEKRLFEKSFETFKKGLNMDLSTETGIRSCLYSIMFAKSTLKMQEALGFVYLSPNGRYITNTKKANEYLQRKSRESKMSASLESKNNAEDFAKNLNPENIKFLMDRNNEVASQNQNDSYNFRFIACQIFRIIKDKNDFSSRQALQSLYEIFRIVYSEKNFYENEEQWLKGKKTIGINYRNYQIKKVNNIIAYKSEKQFSEYMQKYIPPNGNLDIDDLSNQITKI